MYSRYLSEGFGIPLYIAETDTEIDIDNDNNENLVINALQPGNVDQLSIAVNRDGSVTLNGQYYGDSSSYMMSPSSFMLSEGDYVIDAGDVLQDQEHCHFYIEGWKETEEGTKKEILAMTPQKTEFHIERGQYDRFWYGINIVDGFSADNETLYPVIAEVKEAKQVIDSYMPCAVRYYSGDEETSRFIIYYLSKSDLSIIPKRDWAVFVHNIVYRLSGQYDWCSVVFDDGTGIQYQSEASDGVIYGKSDPYGRIKQEYMRFEIDELVSKILTSEIINPQ